MHYGRCASGEALTGASPVTILETIAGRISAPVPFSIVYCWEYVYLIYAECADTLGIFLDYLYWLCFDCSINSISLKQEQAK